MPSTFRWTGAALAALFWTASLTPAQGANPKPAAATAPRLASGQAAGTLTVDGKAIKLAYAAGFVDQSDKDKPVVLLITDQPVPAAGWTSHSDLMPYHMDHRFQGLVLRLDQSRKLIGADYYDGTFPTSTSGYFVVDMKGPAGKALVGSAHSTPAAAAGSHGVKADVTFRADLK